MLALELLNLFYWREMLEY